MAIPKEENDDQKSMEVVTENSSERSNDEETPVQNTGPLAPENVEASNNSEQLNVENEPLAPMDITPPPPPAAATASSNPGKIRPIRQAKLVFKSPSEVAEARAEGRIAPVETPFGRVLFMSLQPLPRDPPPSFSLSTPILQQLFSERDQLLRENRNLNQRLSAFQRQLERRKANAC